MTTSDAVSVHLVDARHPSVEPTWRHIATTTGAGPAAAVGTVATAFSSPTWFAALRDVTATTSDLRVALVRHGPDVVGMLPLEWRVEKAMRTVTLAGAWTGADHCDVVAAPAHARTVADAALDHLAGRSDWDRILFDGVASGGELARALAEWPRRTRYFAHRPTVAHTVPFVRFARMRGDGSGADAVRRKAVRRETRAALRRLRAAGCGLVVTAAPETVDADLVALMRLHRRQFGHRSVVMATELRRTFHREAARRLAAEGHARTWRLIADGHVLKFGYGFVTGDTLAVYQGGRAALTHDAVRSPGIVTFAALIDWAVAEGLSGIDLLRGDHRHKNLFATDELVVERHEILRASVPVAAHLVVAGTRRLSRRLHAPRSAS